MKGISLVLIGASLWGVIGLFVQGLYTYGFTPIDVVALRVLGAALILFPVFAVFQRKWLMVNVRDLPYFAGCGIVSIAFFNLCFFTVIDRSSNSLAVALLYTGPIFVVLLSRLFFKEPLTRGKGAALFMTITGCMFVVGLIPSGDAALSVLTILIGLSSGFFYALYSIFGKFVSKRYHPLTITAYSMLFGSLCIVPFSGIFEHAGVFLEPAVWRNGAGLVLFSTILAYAFYTAGLAKMESGRAAIVATAEPAVAIMIGVIVFKDALTAWQIAGIVCILTAVLFTIDRKNQLASKKPMSKVQ
ncbi:EamA family transporter [Domibacillus epiphyticus]|uniref:EamA family transporter n=1 Tax=Domibacillus epiphyticus TaxID=1714355 RepID=A0A1V2A4F3_9BACI|nr:EamA family transporter [Domibacillus epiphyticus]OMP65817.1 EamA family transporter [Domibacillus epiphyticus]